MKRSIKVLLTSVLIANLLTGCISETLICNNFGYKKVEACEEIDHSNYENKLIDVSNSQQIKEILTSIPQLVKNNDKNYISNREKDCDCEYVFRIDAFYKHDSDIIKSLKSVWNIEDDDYIVVVGIDKNQDLGTLVEGDKLTYFVGVNTGNVIMIPFQGGMEAYSIKDNIILKTYNDVTQISSYKWR